MKTTPKVYNILVVGFRGGMTSLLADGPPSLSCYSHYRDAKPTCQKVGFLFSATNLNGQGDGINA